MTRTCQSGRWASVNLGGCTNVQLQTLLSTLDTIPGNQSMQVLSNVMSSGTVGSVTDVTAVHSVLLHFNSWISSSQQTDIPQSSLSSVVNILDTVMGISGDTFASFGTNSASDTQNGYVLASIKISNLPLASSDYGALAKSTLVSSTSAILLGVRILEILVPSFSASNQVLTAQIKVRVSGAIQQNASTTLQSKIASGALCENLISRNSRLFLGSSCALSSTPQYYADSFAESSDKILESLSKAVNKYQNFSMVTPNIEVYVYGVGCTGTGCYFNTGASNFAVTLPSNMLPTATSVSIVFYANTKLFIDNSLNQTTKSVGSKIFSINVNGVDTSSLSQNFEFTLQNTKSSNFVASDCTFYDLGITNTWKSNGCSVVTSKSTANVTTCSCSHMTNFAVLGSPSTNTPSTKEKVLSSFTVASAAVAIPCLALVIIALTLLRSLWTTHRYAIIQLSLNLLIGLTLFIFGVSESSVTSCKVMAVFMHFCILAAFCWLLADAFMLSRAIREEEGTFTTGPRKAILATLFSYGVPMLAVGIALAVTQNNYWHVDACWPNAEQGVIWSFSGPVIAVIALHWLLILDTFWLRPTMISQISQSKDEQVRRRLLLQKLKLTFPLICLLGLAWLFAFLAVDRRSDNMSVIFTILNGLSAIWILIDNTLLDVDVRRRLYEFITCSRSSTYKTSSPGLQSSAMLGSPMSAALITETPFSSPHYYPKANRSDTDITVMMGAPLSTSPSTRTTTTDVSPTGRGSRASVSSDYLTLQMQRIFQPDYMSIFRRQSQVIPTDPLSPTSQSNATVMTRSPIDSVLEETTFSDNSKFAADLPEEILFNDINPQEVVFADGDFALTLESFENVEIMEEEFSSPSEAIRAAERGEFLLKEHHF